MSTNVHSSVAFQIFSFKPTSIIIVIKCLFEFFLLQGLRMEGLTPMVFSEIPHFIYNFKSDSNEGCLIIVRSNLLRRNVAHLLNQWQFYKKYAGSYIGNFAESTLI